MTRPTARCAAMAALAALSFLAAPRGVDGQINRLRRARERVTSSLPSLGSLFGEEPPITTTLDDVKDGVPALDGFEPESFSPMVEMPRGPGGYYLLAPGAYTMEAESFCIWPGTYEPREGNGYVYAELKGPKAALLSAIVGRAADAPDIDRRAVQELLWAVLSRSKPSEMQHDMQLTAARLLTPEELADMEGYSLNAVPDALAKRVLQDVPRTRPGGAPGPERHAPTLRLVGYPVRGPRAHRRADRCAPARRGGRASAGRTLVLPPQRLLRPRHPPYPQLLHHPAAGLLSHVRGDRAGSGRANHLGDDARRQVGRSGLRGGGSDVVRPERRGREAGSSSCHPVRIRTGRCGLGSQDVAGAAGCFGCRRRAGRQCPAVRGDRASRGRWIWRGPISRIWRFWGGRGPGARRAPGCRGTRRRGPVAQRGSYRPRPVLRRR